MRFLNPLTKLLSAINLKLEESKRKPYFKLRVIIALLLFPVSSYVTLKIADLGVFTGEYMANKIIEHATENPIILIVFATMPMALIFGLFIKFISGNKES